MGGSGGDRVCFGGVVRVAWRTVGFLLTDVAGSTGLWEADGEAMAAAMAGRARIPDQAVSGSWRGVPARSGGG